MNRWVRHFTAFAVVAMSLVGASLMLAPPAEAAPWGACGASTPESKLVRQFAVNARSNYYLRCGNANVGYRHIVARHRVDFEKLAAGTYMNWRDVADLAMESIARDPDVARPAGDGKGCLSRVIYLKNLRTNQVVRQQNFRMFVVLSTGDVITAYPDVRNCP